MQADPGDAPQYCVVPEKILSTQIPRRGFGHRRDQHVRALWRIVK